jgi:hypothetical protein
MSDIVLRFFTTASRGLIEIPNWFSKNVTTLSTASESRIPVVISGVPSVSAAESSPGRNSFPLPFTVQQFLERRMWMQRKLSRSSGGCVGQRRGVFPRVIGFIQNLLEIGWKVVFDSLCNEFGRQFLAVGSEVPGIPPEESGVVNTV